MAAGKSLFSSSTCALLALEQKGKDCVALLPFGRPRKSNLCKSKRRTPTVNAALQQKHKQKQLSSCCVLATTTSELGGRSRLLVRANAVEGDAFEEQEEDMLEDFSIWGGEGERETGSASYSDADSGSLSSSSGEGMEGAAGENENDDDDDEPRHVKRESWSRRNETPGARKKGRTWHKYMKTTRELKRLQRLLPDLEGGSLFADELRGNEALDAESQLKLLESLEDSRNLEQQLDKSGFAYIARGGKLSSTEGILKNLGWNESAQDGEEGSLGGSEDTELDSEVTAADSETEEAEIQAKLEALDDHAWKHSAKERIRSEEGETLDEEEEVKPSISESETKGEWLDYESPPELRPVEQRILEKAMYSSTIRMIHDQEQQSIERARVTWYLKEQFNSEFVLSNYLATMARSIQEEVDGIEIVNFRETGTFICRYKPLIMSKVLFELEAKLKSGEINIKEINELQVQSNRKADLLEKTIAFLCDRSIRMQLAKHLRRNLSFKQDQMKLDPWDRLNLETLEEKLAVERVENIIVRKDEESDAEENEETVLDFLLKEDDVEVENARDIYPFSSSRQRTFKPLTQEDFLPELPDDAVIQFNIDGERVEIDLDKVGEQAIWIRQLLGYKRSDKEFMNNFDQLMQKTEKNFQVRPKKRRDKKQRGQKQMLSERDESRLFQDAVDIFDDQSSKIN